MSDHILSALVDQQQKEDPTAASLLPPFTTPEAVTLEILQARALRQHSTAMPGQRKALAARAWEMHEARCQAAKAEADPSVITVPTVAPEPIPRKEMPGKTATRPRTPRKRLPVEWGGIQVLPVPGDPDKARLIVDRTLDREWALRLASMACNVFVEVR